MVRRSIALLLGVMLATWLSGTAPAFAGAPPRSPSSVSVHVLAQGDALVCSGPCYYVVSDARRFQAFWSKHLSGQPEPHVNFSEQVVAVASEGLLPNSGYNTVEIQKAVQTRHSLKIMVHQVDGDGGPSFYNTPDWPFVVAALPRTSTKVRFIVRADRYSCSGLNQILCGDPSGSLLPGGHCNPVQPNFRSAICYSPSDLPKVETFLDRTILDPSTTIRSMTHLRLRRIIVFLPQITTTASADMYFIYGHLPSSIAGLNMSQAKPSFVVVRENTAGEAYTGAPPVPVLEKSTFHLHTNSPPGQTLLVGPWQFAARIPHQHRWVTVIANAKSSVVRKLGNHVLAALEAQGRAS